MLSLRDGLKAAVNRHVTAALKRLMNDSALRVRMGQAAKQHGEAALWPKQIKRILALKER